MTNERKVELLKLIRKDFINCLCSNAIFETDTDEESEFVLFERNRLIAELDFSIKYYKEHKDDTK